MDVKSVERVLEVGECRLFDRGDMVRNFKNVHSDTSTAFGADMCQGLLDMLSGM